MTEENDEEQQRALKRRLVGLGGGHRAATPRLHLYLVFDDWSRGYSIHKVDISPSGTADHCCRHCGGKRHSLRRRGSDHCLPPPLFRFQVPDAPRWDSTSPYFSAVGSNIVAMVPTEYGTAATGFCFDVHARTLVFVPRHGEALDSTYIHPARPSDVRHPVYFPVGDDRLFVLGTFSFQVLDMAGSSGSEQLDPDAMAWRDLPDAPVVSSELRSHAVHPDGQTIFVSAGIIADEATYSFHTAEDGSSVWRHHGGWVLPFQGRGYYDSDLNAWVGLSLYSLEAGHVVACELMTAGSGYGRRPAWKFSKETLFSEDPAGTHSGATLVYIGGNSSKSRFCLVEGIYVEGDKSYGAYEYDIEEEQDPSECLLRVTTFTLELDENGDLTTGNSRRVRCYGVPKGTTRGFQWSPVAFWM